jgi:hypothetical protein
MKIASLTRTRPWPDVRSSIAGDDAVLDALPFPATLRTPLNRETRLDQAFRIFSGSSKGFCERDG